MDRGTVAVVHFRAYNIGCSQPIIGGAYAEKSKIH